MLDNYFHNSKNTTFVFSTEEKIHVYLIKSFGSSAAEDLFTAVSIVGFVWPYLTLLAADRNRTSVDMLITQCGKTPADSFHLLTHLVY